MKSIQLCGKAVRVDEDGLVCLTDMWKASGAQPKHRPNNFLRLDGTVAFIEEIEKDKQLEHKLNPVKAGIPALTTRKGGATPGTWVDRLLAYKYASFVSAAFEYGVYKVLEAFFSGRLIASPLAQLNDLCIREKVSKIKATPHGVGLKKRQVEKKELREEMLMIMQEIQLNLPLDVPI